MSSPSHTTEYNTEYVRKRRESDPDYHARRKEASKAWKVQHSAKLAKLILDRKDCPCVDCGQQFPSYCMEFDHVRGKKLFGLAKAARDCRSVKSVLEELDKCEVRCVICHRIRHLS